MKRWLYIALATCFVSNTGIAANIENGLMALPDPAGINPPDYVVYNGTTKIRFDVMSGVDGSLLHHVEFFTAAWNPNSFSLIADGNRDGTENDPALIVLAQNATTNQIKAQLRDAMTGSQLQPNIAFFNSDWGPLGVTVLNDSNGDGSTTDPAIAVLAQHTASGRIMVELIRASDGADLGRWAFFNPAWTAKAVVAFSPEGGNPMLAVLATDPGTGKSKVQLRDIVTDAKLSVFVSGSAIQVEDLGILMDLDGDGTKDDPGLVVLGKKGSGNNIVRIRRVSDGSRVDDILMVGSAYGATGLAMLADINSSNYEDVAVLATPTGGGSLLVKLRDLDTGDTIDNLFLDNIPPLPGPGQVETAEGIYQGETVGDLLVFKGIPYAVPPIGALRFKAPAPPASFTGVRDALGFGSVCAQPQGASTVGSEDCLFLNIWGHDDDTVRPVMVYMHPGAANGIGGDLESINPEELANDADVVVVNLNRRIGVLGYLAIDELIAENPRMTAGNYGILDAIEALKWIQNNIDEFNGDPNHVMLFGTSSGGILSCIMLGAPEAAGLVQAVAIQSAPCGGPPLQILNTSSPHASSNPPVTDTHRSILPATGCDVAADILFCLRGLSAEELILASAAAELAVPHALYGAIVDGVVVVHPPRTALQNQTIGDVALIVGMTSNEIGSRFANLAIPDDATYQAVLSNIFVSPIDSALYTLYPSASYPTPKDAFLEAFSDLVFNCNGESLALNAMAGTPSYLYEITRGFDSGSFAGAGAVHAIDIPYLFGTFDVYGYTPDAQALVIRDAMRTAWRALAADPTTAPAISTDGTTLWPAFDPATASYVEFGDTVAGSTNHRGGRCAALQAAL